MEDIRQLADKINGMSDAELEAAIRAVGAAMGADERTLARLSREKGIVRRKLGGASDRELAKIASMLTPDQLDEIKKTVSGGDK